MHNEVIDSRRFNFFIIDNETLDSYDLNFMEIAVYVYLVRCSNKNKECFPGLNKIAKTIKLSKPKVIDCIKTLKSKGLVDVIRRKGEKESNLSNIYIIKEVIKNDKNVIKKEENPTPSKPDLQGASKPELPPLVNEVNHPSKPGLLEEYEFNNTNNNKSSSNIDIYNNNEKEITTTIQIEKKLNKYLDPIQIKKLILLYPAESIIYAINLLEFLINLHPKRIKNPSSYLYTFITGSCNYIQDQELYNTYLEKEKLNNDIISNKDNYKLYKKDFIQKKKDNLSQEESIYIKKQIDMYGISFNEALLSFFKNELLSEKEYLLKNNNLCRV